MVYPPTGSTAYEREMSTPPTLLRSMAFLYLLLRGKNGRRAYNTPTCHGVVKLKFCPKLIDLIRESLPVHSDSGRFPVIVLTETNEQTRTTRNKTSHTGCRRGWVNITLQCTAAGLENIILPWQVSPLPGLRRTVVPLWSTQV